MSVKTVYIKFYTNVDQNSVKKLMDAIEEKLKEGANKFVLQPAERNPFQL